MVTKIIVAEFAFYMYLNISNLIDIFYLSSLNSMTLHDFFHDF